MSGLLPPPHLIEADADVAPLMKVLAAEPALAVDTESNSLFVYRERVCLIQFSTPQADYIVDPLRADVRPLAPLFANPQQQKIFHAAEYDILSLKRDYGFEFANLFDTMVAARTLGWTQTGLAALLEQHFGVKMNKKHQRANWGKRPLSAEQLDYARLDTHYLFQLRDLLLAELTQTGRLAEAQEEFDRLARLKPETTTPDPHAFWRVSGAHDLDARQAAILNELFLYRDRQARRHDVPPFKVMSDATLVALAKQAPQRKEDLRGVFGMTAGQIARHGEELLAAVKRGLAAPPARRPRSAPKPDEVRERFEKLRRWRRQKAQARGVESDVIVPREALWELARRVPRTTADLASLEHLGPWRRQMYGAEILEVLADK
ncbi:MAG: HRDC domain-containing protein [Anaerolineales bacterium]|nr:HRDC domain-containing protein [Anaerolineales bacterium]